MRQFTQKISVKAPGRRLYDISQLVLNWANALELNTGLITLYIQHTSASLLINENYDSIVLVDMEAFLTALCQMGISFLFIQQRAQTRCPDMCVARSRKPVYRFPLSTVKLRLANGKVSFYLSIGMPP